MKTHRPLLPTVVRAGAPAGSHRRVLSARTVRIRAVRGILVLALAFASVGAAALAWPVHGSAGSVHVSGHPAHGRGLVPSSAIFRPWMY